MRCDSQASLLAHNLASPCLGREPKARVATMALICGASVTLFVPLGNTCLHMGTHVLIFHQPT